MRKRLRSIGLFKLSWVTAAAPGCPPPPSSQYRSSKNPREGHFLSPDPQHVWSLELWLSSGSHTKFIVCLLFPIPSFYWHKMLVHFDKIHRRYIDQFVLHWRDDQIGQLILKDWPPMRWAFQNSAYPMLSTPDPPELPYPWKCPQLRHKVPPQGSQSPPFPYVVTLMAPSHHSSVRIKPAPKLTSQSEIHRVLCSIFYRQQSKRKF